MSLILLLPVLQTNQKEHFYDPNTSSYRRGANYGDDESPMAVP